MKQASLIVAALIALIFVTGCKKNTNTNPSTTSNLFFTGTFDGNALDFKVPTNININNYLPYLSGQSSNGQTANERAIEQASGIAKVDLASGDIIEGCTVNFYSTLVKDAFGDIDNNSIKNMIQKMSYPFGNGANSVVGNVQVYVVMVINGVEYSSNAGSGDQTGSNFTVSNIADNDLTSEGEYIITSTLNCKMYDAQGNMKVLSGAQMKSTAVVYF